MTKPALLALLVAAAGAASAQPDGWTPDATLERLAAEARDACSAPNSPPPDIGQGLVYHAFWLAGLQERVNTPCTPQPALALRIARAAANRPDASSSEAYRLLSELYTRGLGVRRDAAAARRHLDRAWLLGHPSSPQPPFADRAEIDAFLARGDTIAFLTRYADVRDMHYVRLRLARGLLVRGNSRDRARAAGLLADLVLQGDAEARFLRARMTIEDASDPAQRAQAMRDLGNVARNSAEGSEARALLTRLARRQLGSPETEERWDAVQFLATAAFTLEPAAVAELLRAVSAANGGLPPASLSGPEAEPIRERLRAPMSDDDYPAAALRAEEEERIVLRGLIDPRGRLIFTLPLLPDQSPRLLNWVRAIYARRLNAAVDLGALRTTPYMWVELPAVVFRIAR